MSAVYKNLANGIHAITTANVVPTAEGLDVVDGAGIIKGNEDIACERGDAKPDLTTDTSAVYPKPSDLRGQYP